MRLSMIWAMSRNRVIGVAGDLPWRLPDEMRHFMKVTRGKPVIMGRRTFASMPQALPGRTNIVLTRDAGYTAPGAEVVADLDAAVSVAARVCRRDGVDEAVVIGGAEIYALALPHAQRLYQTVVDADLEGDTHFPDFDESVWRQVERVDHPVDARHPFAYSIQTLERTG